jgi:pyruvate dehydrogenase E2 component (dihydrolipoamide acetyltransferase)
MATEIKMPQLGLTMTEGIIGAWKIKVGDQVKIGDVLAEIQTDKLTNELIAEVEGQVLSILAEPGVDVPVQGLLCVIGTPGEKISSVASVPKSAIASVPAPVAQTAQAATPGKPTGNDPKARLHISPLAKKIALEKNIDCSRIIGSGPGGRIIKKDILNFKDVPTPISTAPAPLAAAPAENAGQTRERMSQMRKVVADRMLKSHTEIPVVTQNVKADVTNLLEFRQKLNQNREQRFSINDLLLKAVAKALAANASYMLVSIEGSEIIRHEHVNLGMAVAIESGLIVPVIKDADKLSLSVLAARAKDLAERARSGSLQMEEYQGSSFSVSNLGMYKVESFTPIINQPNAGILGISSIEDELAMLNGEISVRKITRLCLTYDHRLLDGASAAKFQMAVKELLENPLEILI